jgi:hypothetical protein
MARDRRNGIAILWLLFAGVVAALPLLADGSQFGTLTGKLKDESGGAIPGVSMELTSDDKGFRRSAVTDEEGNFNFLQLPPGTYTVRAELAGFESVVATNNVVAAERTTTVPMTLKLSKAAESVEVVGDVPLVDKTNTSDTTIVSSELTDKLPIGRAYQNVVDFAPGQNDIDGDGNPNARGAPDSANVFLFDGVDTTDPTVGHFGSNNNFDTIQEVVVSNANLSAEYGRVQGTLVNVITKTGTNIFHGSGRALVTNDSWNADNKGINPLSGDPWNREKVDQQVYDYTFTLGGPVWKDNIWFFGAYERNPQTNVGQTQTSPINPVGTGEQYEFSPTFVAWQGKLNAQINGSNALVFSAQADPFTGIANDYWGAAADVEALTSQSQADDCPWACIWSARYSGVFGPNLSAELTYAGQRGGILVGSFSGDGSPYVNLSDGLVYNGSAFVGFVDRPRNQANAAFNYYTTLGERSHNFKVGVDYQDIESTNAFAYPNDELFVVTDFDPVTKTPILAPGDQWFQYLPLEPSTSTGTIWGIYALDRFDLTDRLSFNLGVRADIQTAKSDLNNTVVDTTTFSPRLSASYDISGTGKTIASGGFGRYYEFIAQSMVDSLYSGVPQEVNADAYIWTGSEWVFDYPIRAGGNDQPVNPDLTPSYVDEFNLAVQHQIGTTMAVAARGIYRKWHDIIDDIKIFTEDGVRIATPRNFSNDIIDREYKAFELTFNKRFSDRFQAVASYTLSEVTGNADRSWGQVAFTSQLLDYPDDICEVPAQLDDNGNVILPAVSGPCPEILGHNRGGPLPWDLTNSVKIYTAYTYPIGNVRLTGAPSLTWFSGLPFQQQRLLQINGDTDTYYDTPQGSARLKDWYQLNFSLEAVFPLVEPVEIAVKADIFNVTNQQPVIDPTRVVLTPTDDFGTPTSLLSFNAPRGYQFGAVVRF